MIITLEKLIFKYYKHVNNLIEKLEIKLKEDIVFFI